jgi:hypothetical protein
MLEEVIDEYLEEDNNESNTNRWCKRIR